MWLTKDKVKELIRDIYKVKPKYLDSGVFVLSNEVPKPFKSYKGIELIHSSLMPKNTVQLMTREGYNLLNNL